MNKTYESELLAAVHETAQDLSDAGMISLSTMRTFDDLCLTTIRQISAEEIRAIRTANNVSQCVFARYLNVSVSSVSQWERGEKSPSGSTLKLLLLVEKRGLEAIA